MARKTRVVSQRAKQTPEQIEQLIEQWIEASNARFAEIERNTFDVRVAPLERRCRQEWDGWTAMAKSHGRSRSAPRHKSPVWYAREILIHIAEAREARDAGELEQFAREEGVVFGLERHRLLSPKQERAGRGRGKQIAAIRRDQDAKTHRLVQQYHDSDESQSVGLVKFLVSRLGENPQTIRRRLKRLRISTT